MAARRRLDRYLVHEQAVTGPATHAIVIGVSAYPHLGGGGGELTRNHEGMGQLSSPTPSAHTFASWLIRELNDPAKPLASVAMLVSDEESPRFRNARTGERHAVRPATIGNAIEAVTAWGDRGTSAEDRLIFYFCGHGLANATRASLLLSDFGASRRNALAGAIDFSSLWLGLENVAAREQCFFIDACRANARTTLAADGYMGEPIFLPDVHSLSVPGPPPRQAPVFYSTILGELAYGRAGVPSPFTEALIRGFEGAGSNNNEGDWRVDTVGLKQALDFFMLRAFQSGIERAPVPQANNLTNFDLHFMSTEPEAVVLVGCEPGDATPLASFSSLSDGRVVGQRAPALGDYWEVNLPSGNYEFVADFAEGAYRRASTTWYVAPPYRKLPPLVVSR